MADLGTTMNVRPYGVYFLVTEKKRTEGSAWLVQAIGAMHAVNDGMELCRDQLA